jgi:hypothetical protein
VQSFDEALLSCQNLMSFSIANTRRTFFHYIKGERIVLTKCSLIPCENLSLILFFQRHQSFASICLRRFELSDSVLDGIARNVGLVTLHLYQCGEKYGINALCRITERCPLIENISLSGCHKTLATRNRLTETIINPIGNKHLNIILLNGTKFVCWKDFQVFSGIECSVKRELVESDLRRPLYIDGVLEYIEWIVKQELVNKSRIRKPYPRRVCLDDMKVCSDEL